MFNPYKLKMFICKLLTCWILHPRYRKLAWSFLYWFSYADYVRFKNSDYQIVSLGSTCFSRAIAVAVGIKPRRFYGEKSCPFDLYFSTDIKRTTDLIENDFIDFFENINLNNFPHDQQLTVKQFRERYSRRIQNFLDIEQSDKKVYYIYSNYNAVDTKDITRLYAVLKDKRKGKPFELILLTRKQIDVSDVIQIPYDIDLADSRLIQLIINRYRENNKFTQFRDYMEKELKKVIGL